jgi:hypothetical protein
MSAQDGPHARGSKDDTHPCELTLDPAIAPGGILVGQLQDDRNGAVRNAPASRSVGIGPLTPDQVPVPAEQSLGLNKESASTPTIKQPTQPGKQRPIGRTKCRSGHLTTEHCNLVAEPDDFNGQLVTFTPAQMQQLEDSDEGNVEKREGHDSVSWAELFHGSPAPGIRMTFSAPTGPGFRACRGLCFEMAAVR